MNVHLDINTKNLMGMRALKMRVEDLTTNWKQWLKWINTKKKTLEVAEELNVDYSAVV